MPPPPAPPLPAPATPPPPPPLPPPPTLLPELINLVLAAPIANEEQMSEAEALACILNVTERRPKWLISQVHPDKQPGFLEEAIAAAARVNQAMDVRSRHVNEV